MLTWAKEIIQKLQINILQVNELKSINQIVLEILTHFNHADVVSGKNMLNQLTGICELPFLSMHQEIILNIAVFTTVFCRKILTCLGNEYFRSPVDSNVIQFGGRHFK